MEKRNIVLITDHLTAIEIFNICLFDIRTTPILYEHKTLRVSKNSKYAIQNISSQYIRYQNISSQAISSRAFLPTANISEELKIIEYDIDVDMIMLDDVPNYDFSNVDAVLFFCEGDHKSQMETTYMNSKYIRILEIPCVSKLIPSAIFIPHDYKEIEALREFFTKIIKWQYSLSSTLEYIDIILDLLEPKDQIQVLS